MMPETPHDEGLEASPVSAFPSPISGKSWWQSRTIIGAVIVLLASFAGIFGWSVDSDATTEIALQVASVVGAVLAIYGRVRAEQPIRRVRRALPVGKSHGQDAHATGNPRIPRGGLNKGFVHWSVVGAMAVIVSAWGVALAVVLWVCNMP